MKTTTVARGFIGAVASLLGVVAVGCSADGWDEASAGNGEIGSTSQALTKASGPDILDIDEDAPGFEHMAACHLLDGATTKLVYYGGYDPAGTGVDKLWLLTPGTPGTFTQLDSIQTDTNDTGQGRGEAEFVQISNTECLLVGGLSTKSKNGVTGVTTPNVYSLTLSSGAAVWTKKGVLNAGRAKFGVAKCGSSDVIVVGGHGTAVSTPISGANYIEHLNGVSGSTSWATLTKPTDLPEVHSAGFAVDLDANNHFVQVGGRDNGGAVKSEVVPLVATVNGQTGLCTAINTLTSNNTSVIGRLKQTDDSTDQGRFGLVSFFRASSDTFLAAAGDSGALLPDYAEEFTVNFSTPAISRNSTEINMPIVTGQTRAAMRYPELLLAPQGGDDWILVGGENRSSAGNPLESAPQVHMVEFETSSWTTSYLALASARLGAGVAFDGSVAYAVAGMDSQTGPSLRTDSEKITP